MSESRDASEENQHASADRRDPAEEGVDTNVPVAGDDDAQWFDESPGQMLRRAREDQNLSRHDLVAQTKISRAVVEAMESDDFDALGEPVYVRGYFRRCARVTGLPEDELIAAYESFSGEPRPRPVQPLVSGGDAPLYPRRNWLPLVLLLVLGCVLVAAIIYWTNIPAPAPAAPQPKQSEPHSGNSASEPSTAEIPGFAAKDETRRVNTERRPARQTDEPAVLPGRAVMGVSAIAGSAVEPAAATARVVSRTGNTKRPAAASRASHPGRATAASARKEPEKGRGALSASAVGDLHLSFDHKCWVSVRDAAGKRLMVGIATAGTRKDLTGEPPYRVVLGYAPGVTMTFDGKTVDLKAHTRDDASARLTVGGS